MSCSYIYSLQLQLPSIPTPSGQISLGGFKHQKGQVAFDLTELEEREVDMPMTSVPPLKLFENLLSKGVNLKRITFLLSVAPPRTPQF